MNLSKYIKSFFTRSIKKVDLVEDIEITKNEIIEYTLPGYVTALDLFKNLEFKHKTIKAQEKTFSRLCNSNDLIAGIESGLKNCIENLTSISKVLNADTSSNLNKIGIDFSNQELAAMGLTYRQANVLRFLENAFFVSRFSRVYLSYLLAHELALKNVVSDLTNTLSKNDIEFIENNFNTFCSALNTVNLKKDDFVKKIDNIVDAIITDDNESSLMETIGETKVDPFKTRFISSWLNPIYHVRIAIATWQVNRAKIAELEKQKLELMLLQLRRVKENTNDVDPVLEKEIAILESRIHNLKYKIDQIEKGV